MRNGCVLQSGSGKRRGVWDCGDGLVCFEVVGFGVSFVRWRWVLDGCVDVNGGACRREFVMGIDCGMC